MTDNNINHSCFQLSWAPHQIKSTPTFRGVRRGFPTPDPMDGLMTFWFFLFISFYFTGGIVETVCWLLSGIDRQGFPINPLKNYKKDKKDKNPGQTDDLDRSPTEKLIETFISSPFIPRIYGLGDLIQTPILQSQIQSLSRIQYQPKCGK